MPRQRNGRDENARIKAGETPAEWLEESAKPMLRQKDVEARWTKKNAENHYGYKNHINADQGNKLVQSYQVTDAAVHDSQVFEELLDQTADGDGNKRTLYADSAYRSTEKEAQLAADKIASQICEVAPAHPCARDIRASLHIKGTRNHPLTEQQKASNREKSKVRARVEHVFGAQAQMGGHIVRTIGLLRAAVKVGLMNLVYNMVRLGQLIKRDGRVASAVA